MNVFTITHYRTIQQSDPLNSSVLSRKLLLFYVFSFILSFLMKAGNIPIDNFLKFDGSLNLTTLDEKLMNFDLKGWNVELDPLRGPVFNPKPPAAIGWSAFDDGFNGTVRAVAVSGADIYIGGDFTAVGAGGAVVPGVNYIAKWNGSSWSALGQGLNGIVRTIAVSGTDIYVGGDFTNVGGGTAVSGLNRIAKWEGSSWSALGQGLNNSIKTIAVSGTTIYAGGDFTGVGGGTAITGLSYIAQWNGSVWSGVGQGLNSKVYAIAVSSAGIVYASGQFSDVFGGSGSDLFLVGKWNGSSWSGLANGLNGYVYAIAVSGTDVYFGGEFSGTNGGLTSLNRFAKWNGSSWSDLGGTSINNHVRAIAISSTGEIYAGGHYSDLAAAPSGFNGIIKRSGSSWSALNNGLNNSVLAIAVSGTNVYAGGAFTAVGTNGTAVAGLNQVARWGELPTCTNPTAFNVTGGGSYTVASAFTIGLDGSETGVTYQLKKETTTVGSVVAC
jgi:hypothetical protein